MYIAELPKLAQRYVDLATSVADFIRGAWTPVDGNRFQSEACVDAITEHLWQLYYAAIANEGHPEKLLERRVEPPCRLFLAAISGERCNPARRDDVPHARINAGH